ncbi:MAG: tetratricopeptide repeat protein [Sandaracinaceae bacterium]
MADVERIDPRKVPHEMQDRRSLAEQMAGLASAAFQASDVVKATQHACDLLLLFPNERRYLDLFDEIVLSTDDPLALVQVEPGNVHVADAAGRARVLMMARRLPEALQLLCRAVDLAPAAPYLHWVLRWLQPPIIQSLDATLLSATVIQSAVDLALGVPVPPWRHDRRIPNLRAGAETLAAIRAIYPNDATFYWGEAELRRRLKEGDQAIAAAEAGLANHPEDALLLATLANVYGDAGRTEEALDAARKAEALGSETIPVGTSLYAVGKALIEVENWAQAESVLGEVLDLAPAHGGAAAYRAYARYRADSSEDAMARLRSLRERHVADETVRALADEVDPPVPYVNVLPNPDDAGADFLRAYVNELRTLKPLGVLDGPANATLRTRHLGSPSLGVAFSVAARTLGTMGALTFAVEELQTPDPRSDKAALSTPIWSYDGLSATSLYPDVNSDAQAAVAAIAASPFHRDTWGIAARQVAERFGNEGFHGMLSVLTQPPAPPEDFDAITWTWRAQVACAVVISHLGGWDGGAARAGIYSMLYGPNDWITGAAVIALAWRAFDTPAVRQETQSTFAWMRSIVPEQGLAAWEAPLLGCMRMFTVDDESRSEINAAIAAYGETKDARDEAFPIERGYGGLSFARYAEFSAERDRIVGETGIPTVGPGRISLPEPPPALAELCTAFGVPLRHPGTGAIHPYIDFWEVALDASPKLRDTFDRVRRTSALAHLGATEEEMAALEALREGKEMRERAADSSAQPIEEEEDPVLFPGEPLERLSDYVSILQQMQAGDMDKTLAARGLDMESYAAIAQKWSARLAGDADLTRRFHRLMGG